MVARITMARNLSADGEDALRRSKRVSIVSLLSRDCVLARDMAVFSLDVSGQPGTGPGDLNQCLNTSKHH